MSLKLIEQQFNKLGGGEGIIRTLMNELFINADNIKNDIFIIYVILPEILIGFSVIFIIIETAKLYNLNIMKKLLKIFESVLIIIIFLLGLNLILYDNEIYLFNNSYIINIYTQMCKLLSILILYCILQLGKGMFITNSYTESIILYNICSWFGLLMISITHVGILILALEGFSLSLYMLSASNKLQGGIMASVKYFTFGTFGSMIMLFGVSQIYYETGSFLYEDIWKDYNNSEIYMQIVLIIIGFIIKLGAAPFHVWIPSVYSGIDTINTAFFAVYVKFILIIVFINFSLNLNLGLLIDISAILSIIIGTILALRQLEIKRFIAYSAITHTGFILLGDFISMWIYILTYVLSILLFFSVILSKSLYNNELVYFNDIRHYKKDIGIGNMLILSIALMSMAGLPPTAGFYGKLMIMSSLIEEIYITNNIIIIFILCIIMIITLLTIFYYMRLYSYIYICNEESKVIFNEYNSISHIENIKIYNIQVILILFILLWSIIDHEMILYGINISIFFY